MDLVQSKITARIGIVLLAIAALLGLNFASATPAEAAPKHLAVQTAVGPTTSADVPYQNHYGRWLTCSDGLASTADWVIRPYWQTTGQGRYTVSSIDFKNVSNSGHYATTLHYALWDQPGDGIVNAVGGFSGAYDPAASITKSVPAEDQYSAPTANIRIGIWLEDQRTGQDWQCPTSGSLVWSPNTV